MAPICTALNLSDETKCQEEATSSDGLFCRFHAKQYYGLYRGYKIRNARLDALNVRPPVYLAESQTPLRNEGFAGVADETVLQELHTHLFQKHALLDRVIRARKLHHSRFYSLTLDYGHKPFLVKLTNEKFVVLRALERLERRTAEVLYAKRKWFKWVRERQDEEEAARDKEAEMVKKEAKLFRRQWKEVQGRLKEKRRLEDLKRQEAFLEDAYEERMKQRSEEFDDDEAWDPIEDAVEDERAQFVDLMKHPLWLDRALEPSNDVSDIESSDSKAPEPVPIRGKENVDPHQNKVMNKNAKKRAKVKAKASEDSGEDTVRVEVNETRDQMGKRLREGVRFNPGVGVRGQLLAGTVESPVATMGKMPEMPEDEVEKILNEVEEIKLYLFCRLLLSQAAILPAALRATSVEELLNDGEVTTADLRDLCLRVERPSLQEIRDACADYFRGVDGDEEEDDATQSDEESDEDDPDTKGLTKLSHKHLPETWRSKHEEQVDEEKVILKAMKASQETMVDFCNVQDGQFKARKIRVKVCGKTIWNYPSNRSMSRGGWLHFSIIAQPSLFRIHPVVPQLGGVLGVERISYLPIFPCPHWERWAGDRFRQQLLQLCFIRYLQFDAADAHTVHHRAGGRGKGGRAHAAVEFKNIIAAHIKRDDAVSRRFLQYLCLQAGSVVVLVRDAKTGQIVVTPDKEHCWLIRKKAGIGRTLRTEWTVTRSVEEHLFEQISGKKMRDWQFGFTEYYDVIVWDLEPGKSSTHLYSTIQEAFIKAHRMCEGPDMYEPMAPIIKTLRQDR